MNDAELTQVLFKAIAEARSNFDFWLTTTSAALVGGHYTLGSMNRGFRVLALK